MQTTIIFAHPYHGSFNKAILDIVIQKEEYLNNKYNIIDLNKDKFNPVLEEKDLATYSKGTSSDSLVNKYNEILDRTNKVILIFPLWWYDMPAILRGFFDKVMLNGSAFSEEDDGLHAIRNIDKTIVISTSAATNDDLINNFGDPVNGTIIKATFPRIGFNNARWYNIESIVTKDENELENELKKIEELI